MLRWLLRRLATHHVGPHRLLVHEEGGMLWAEVDGLPGCFASGSDLAELREAAREAVGMCQPAHGPVAKWGQRWDKTNRPPR